MSGPEDELVGAIQKVIERDLPRTLVVRRGAALLYEVTVDHNLEIRVDPRKPSRGHGAFQTDLCIFEVRGPGLEIPRVVLEFKAKLSTHDVLTYSAKARRHKQVYPYLRYGLVTGKEVVVPRRFYLHNEALDFCVAAGRFARAEIRRVVAHLLKKEVGISRQLEHISSGEKTTRVYRTSLVLAR